MKRPAAAIFGMLIATSVLSAFAVSGLAQDDKVILFSKDDPQMNAAIEKARGSLAGFWEKFKTPASNEDGFSLKVMISDDASSEHFWCSAIEGDATKASCAIANEPQSVRSVTLGQRIDVNPDHISDWMYRLDGKIKGGETIRVMLERMPKEQADAYRSLLADQ
ncbi:MAG: DUF2314 domain-containing protein [Rhizobiales bacterium]|nr:DUF2314 domain-containing protein [Hyphomicrobiales bacterium]